MTKFKGLNSCRLDVDQYCKDEADGVWFDPDEVAAMESFVNANCKWTLVTLRSGVQFKVFGNGWHLLKQIGLIEQDANSVNKVDR